MQPVKASAVDPLPLISRFEELGPKRGFRVERYGSAEDFPLIALTRRTPGPRPRIYISATSHGDEPAGSATLLALLEDGFFDQRANWFLCPVINPVGLSLGTRENRAGIDLNRDYRNEPKSGEVRAHLEWLKRQPRFEVNICLHEDWEFPGFYVYELNPSHLPSLAEPIIEAVSKVCPIELRDVIDGRPAAHGIIRPVHDPAERELWPESIYLRANHSVLCYTTESPSSQPLSLRVAAQAAALKVVVERLGTY